MIEEGEPHHRSSVNDVYPSLDALREMERRSNTEHSSAYNKIDGIKMVSEGGKLVPRVLPSVKQIEKTKPKKLPLVKHAARGMTPEERGGTPGWGRHVSDKQTKLPIEQKMVPPLARTFNDQKTTTMAFKGEDKDVALAEEYVSYFHKDTNEGDIKQELLNNSLKHSTSTGQEYLSGHSNDRESDRDGRDRAHKEQKQLSQSHAGRIETNSFANKKQQSNLNNYKNYITDKENHKTLKNEINLLREEIRELQKLKSINPSTEKNNVHSVDKLKTNEVLTRKESQKKSVAIVKDVPLEEFKKENTDSKPESKQIIDVNNLQTKSRKTSNGNVNRNSNLSTTENERKHSYPTIRERNANTKFPFSHQSPKKIYPSQGRRSLNLNHNKKYVSLNTGPQPYYNPKMKFESMGNNNKKITPNPNSNQKQVPRSFKERLLSTPLSLRNKRRKAFVDRRGPVDGSIPEERPRSGCCGGCWLKLMRAPSNACILLPWHLFLLATLFLYLLMGTFVIMKNSEGRVGAWHWDIVSGEQRDTDHPTANPDSLGRAKVREVVTEMVLDSSLEAVLVRSKDAVLDIIRHSNDMEAYVRAFSNVEFQKQKIPSDSDLESVSDDIRRRWKEDLHSILVRNDYLADLYTLGYQVTPETAQSLLSMNNPVPKGVSWDYPSAFLHSFCMITSIGGGSRAGGQIRPFLVVFAAFGMLLYYHVVKIWAKRLNASYEWTLQYTSKKLLNITKSDNKIDVSKQPTFTIIWFSVAIIILYILGVGSTIGSPGAGYGDRLEAACLSLLLVRPPYPLPQDEMETSFYVMFVIIGHILLMSLITLTKNRLQKCFSHCFGG